MPLPRRVPMTAHTRFARVPQIDRPAVAWVYVTTVKSRRGVFSVPSVLAGRPVAQEVLTRGGLPSRVWADNGVLTSSF